jgi:catalase
MTVFYIPYSDDVEFKPLDEDENIRRVLAAMQGILEHAAAKDGFRHRDVHVKSHGCARGTLTVLPDLPDELAQGLFQHAATYEAVARFSNGAGQENPDSKPDARGMAVKVFGVPGTKLLDDEKDAVTQDFVMVNYPAFVAANVKKYLPLEQAIEEDDKGKLLTGDTWNPLRWHWGEVIRAVQTVMQRPANPASITYYSMAPIRYGRYIAKYRALPVDTLRDELTQLGDGPNALGDLLARTLRDQDVHFELQVQLRTVVETMPIEDATVVWPEKESPFRTVARLTLHDPDIANPAWEAACKGLAFTVWHAIPEHRPLGGINRLRKDVYRLSSTWRHDGKRPEEPTSLAAIH